MGISLDHKRKEPWCRKACHRAAISMRWFVQHVQTRRLGSFQGLRTARCQARFHFDPQSTAWKVQLFVNGLSNKGAVSTVTSTSNGASDLERIGDLAENVAQRHLGSPPL